MFETKTIALLQEGGGEGGRVQPPRPHSQEYAVLLRRDSESEALSDTKHTKKKNLPTCDKAEINDKTGSPSPYTASTGGGRRCTPGPAFRELSAHGDAPPPRGWRGPEDCHTGWGR